MPIILNTEILVLDESLDYSEAQARRAVDHFLDYEKPPDTIRLYALGDAHVAVEAIWYGKEGDDPVAA